MATMECTKAGEGLSFYILLRKVEMHPGFRIGWKNPADFHVRGSLGPPRTRRADATASLDAGLEPEDVRHIDPALGSEFYDTDVLKGLQQSLFVSFGPSGQFER